MEVYLDAVFYPDIYKHKEIFCQEGWHYEMESMDAPLTVNGVVYNEMKGVFSSPDEVLAGETMAALYPDTSYAYESGGDPDHIPELDYERFWISTGNITIPAIPISISMGIWTWRRSWSGWTGST